MYVIYILFVRRKSEVSEDIRFLFFIFDYATNFLSHYHCLLLLSGTIPPNSVSTVRVTYSALASGTIFKIY